MFTAAASGMRSPAWPIDCDVRGHSGKQEKKGRPLRKPPHASLVTCCLRAALALVAIAFAPLALAVDTSCIPVTSAYVENPRFGNIADTELYQITKLAAMRFQLFFGRCITIDPPRTLDISAVFDNFTPELKKLANGLILDPPTSASIAELSHLMAAALKKEPSTLAEQIAYVNHSGAFRVPPDTSVDDLATRLVRYQLAEMEVFKSTPLRDGKAVIDGTPYNQFMYWVLLPKTRLKDDLYLTNQPIVSMELGSPSIHSALRGGISNGVTSPCAHCDHGTASIVSLYAIYATDAAVRKIRTEAAYSSAERRLFAADIIAHELGHQMFQLGHPFGLDACVMDPVEVLNFRERSKGLKAHACGEDRSPALKPGAAGFPPDIAVPYTLPK
jgi:hypothetical protein